MKFLSQLKLITLCLFFASSQVFSEALKIHGFVSQGVIQASDSNFVNDEGDATFKLTEIGVNASYRINSSLRVAGQGVYLNGGNRYPEGLRIDYLFLDWQLLNTQTWNVKAQIGRNKNYHWLYSSTRDVPHTRPSIVLPQSLYFDAFRDVAIGVDGLVLVTQTNNDFGEWDINFSYGKSKISKQEHQNLLGKAALGDLSQPSDKQFSLYWRPTLSNVQFGISILDADFKYSQAPTDTLFNGDVTSQRLMLNILYQGERWEFASEIMKERVLVDNLLFPGYTSNVTAEGGYIQGRYFMTPDVTLLTRLDLYDRDRKDRKGAQIEAMSAGFVSGYFGYMDQGTLGLSWRLFKNTQVQTEFHRVKGASRLAPVFTPDVAANNSKYWNMWAVQLMYWF